MAENRIANEIAVFANTPRRTGTGLAWDFVPWVLSAKRAIGAANDISCIRQVRWPAAIAVREDALLLQRKRVFAALCRVRFPGGLNATMGTEVY